MRNSLYFFRLKLLFKDKLTCVIVALSFLIFIFVINSLSLSAKERSNIPIGVLDLDHSESSEQLVKKVKQIPALYVYEDNMEHLSYLINEEQINGIFVIEEGYEKAIKKGKINELITMFYLENNKTAKIIADIFAGEMLYDICLYKGMNLYQAIPGVTSDQKQNETSGNFLTRKFSQEEYIAYTRGLTQLSDFDFAFDISVIHTMEKKQETSEKLNNSVIYLQIVWGILGMLLSFIAMFMAAGVVLDKEMGLEKRIGISLLKVHTIDLSHLYAILTVLSGFSLLSCILLGGKIQNFNREQGVSLYVLTLLFSLCLGLGFILLGKMIHTVGKYQLIGTILILILGFAGFINLFQSFFSSKLINISKIVPNNWFIQGFTDIILNNTLQDIPFTAHNKLVILSFVLIIMNRWVGHSQNR